MDYIATSYVNFFISLQVFFNQARKTSFIVLLYTENT